MVKLFQGIRSGQPPDPAAPGHAEIPEGLKQIGDTIETIMPMVERITGLNRKDIFLQLMKTGIKGGNLETFINGFLGKPPAQEAKFVRYVKTLAIWVPVSCGLFVLVAAFAFLVFRLITMATGAV